MFDGQYVKKLLEFCQKEIIPEWPIVVILMFFGINVFIVSDTVVETDFIFYLVISGSLYIDG